MKIATMKFQDLPTTYAELVALYPPRPIHDDTDLANATEVGDILAGNEHRMSDDQDDYFDAICTFIERYESEDANIAEISGIELLKACMEETNTNSAEVARILGVDPSTSSRILNGSRNITVDHANRLGERFKIEPAAFLRR